MSLELIHGPPNSGRTGLVLELFERTVHDDPLLVVPTADDVARFERELCERPAAALGGSVTTFPGLFSEVARAVGAGGAQALTPIQRLWLARAAAARTPLRALRRSAAHEGFAPALAALFDDLQSAGLDGPSLAAACDELEDGRYERELAALLAAYEELRDELGRGDSHVEAASATARVRSDPRAWRGRPVLLHGFDDLSREQVELVAALAATAPVTVAFTYEDREALAARAELLGVLESELGGEIITRLDADPSNTPSPTLFALERGLFEPGAEPVPHDGAVTLLESAGERGEAELIGRRIARLIASGSEPDAIAIVTRNPDRQAPALVRALEGLGIPVAAEASVPLAATATGTTMRNLLAIAVGDGSAEQVVAFLRGPARARPESVDWLERRVRRERLTQAAEALEAWSGEVDRRIWPLDAIEESTDARSRAAALGRIARDVAERPHLRAGIEPAGGQAVELRAASELARAVAELVELGPHAPRLEELDEALRHLTVPLWQGSTEGRVRVLSPYRLRAGRVEHLFVAGMVDGSFPSAAASQPLLPDERRRELGLPGRRDIAAEERYLFHTCISRPLVGLHLSYPTSDEAGAAVARSPFVDELRDLLSPPPGPDPESDPLAAELIVSSGPADVVAPPEEATSERELARALAVWPPKTAEARAGALDLPEATRERALAAVAGAREAAQQAAEPGPLREPAVLEHLGASELFGASTLEEYDTCSYRWFVNHELDPQRIEPDPEPLETGGIVHATLERLYAEPPAGPRPNPETLELWVAAAGERVREEADARGWDLGAAHARISLSRLDAVLERFLRRDAETGGPMAPDPELLELSFGEGPDDQHPAARIGDFSLHGRIDRIDVSADGKALIRDYKLSSRVVAGKKLLEEGKLQMPLYMLAVAGMGMEPIGGLYHPLGAGKDDRPRGLLAKEHKGSLLPGATTAHYGTDFYDSDALVEILDAARDRAGEIVASIRRGEISRNPRGGKCPPWCEFAPICRIERGAPEPDPDEEEAAA